ncbi:4-alpha-glucanotransferase, partial [Clostridium perfringens]|uniref:4-alpha-glucanotransferase n=1 Tax=Clostridium perfringens TaxID=1502 RepID=UPI002AC44014
FRGFAGYWSIPYEDETAANGKWEVGPGIELFDAIREELGDINVIAEDLGYITEDVKQLLDYNMVPNLFPLVLLS